MSLLELQGVSKVFSTPAGQSISVLRAVDLQLNAGETLAILGRSGSGKSTLLNLLGLLDRPSTGSVLLEGRNLSSATDTELARQRGASIGFVFQQFHLLDRRTAWENVSEPLLFGTIPELRSRRRRSAELLEQVGLADRMDAMPNVLSGGEQQRVAIARALARRPKIVLADEPTGALDASTGDRVLSVLFSLTRSEQMALVIVTHDLDVAKRVDRVLTLADGQLSE